MSRETGWRRRRGVTARWAFLLNWTLIGLLSPIPPPHLQAPLLLHVILSPHAVDPALYAPHFGAGGVCHAPSAHLERRYQAPR